MLAQLSISDYAAKLASSEPAPGGGSAAALSGLIGASLVQMVINLTIGRSEFAAHTALLEQKQTELVDLHRELELLIDRDAVAFSAVMDAYKLSKESGEDKQHRTHMIQQAVKTAAEVPLTIARSSLEVLEISRVLLGKVNQHAVSDLVVGSQASHTAIIGALLNTAANLPLMKDENQVNAYKGQIQLLRITADELLVTIRAKVFAEVAFAIMQEEVIGC